MADGIERKDQATIRRLPNFFGIETLSASYLRQHFKPHAHDEYLLGVIDGGVHAVWCRGEINRVPEGSVVTMRPGDVHHGGAGSDTGWRQRMIYIPENGMLALLSDITDRDKTEKLDFAAAFHAMPDLARRFASLHEILHSSTHAMARDVALDALLGAILQQLVPDITKPSAEPKGRIADAVEYLDTRVAQNVSLDELCAVTGLRRRQTIAAFRRTTGLPPHAWHLQKKIKGVKHLLREGVSPAAAAAELGFADQSHMGRHFAAIVGVTPVIYARG